VRAEQGCAGRGRERSPGLRWPNFFRSAERVPAGWRSAYGCSRAPAVPSARVRCGWAGAGCGCRVGGRLGCRAEEGEGGLGAVVAAGGGDLVQVPGHGTDDGAAGAAGLDRAAHQQQPAVEDGVRAGRVGVLEEGEVDQAGAVLQGDEDDPLAARDRRGLGGGPHAGDQDLLPGAQFGQVGGVGRADLAQQPVVVLHQMPGDVDAEVPNSALSASRPVISGRPLGSAVPQLHPYRWAVGRRPRSGCGTAGAVRRSGAAGHGG
jgi:hypothetical protein